MSNTTCFVCHSPLAIQSKQFARCTNETCPEGSLFVHCGYCKEFSVTVGNDNSGPLICRNPRCKMHGVARTVCPSCQKYSLSKVGDTEICISRTCASNAAILKNCHFCGQSAFLSSPETKFCTKGDCEYLLVRMERCRTCGQNTLDTGAAKCRNPACKRFNHTVEICGSCQQLSRVDGICESPDCPSNAGGEVFQETLMGDILGNIREVLPDVGGRRAEAPGRPVPLAALAGAPVAKKRPPLNDLTGDWPEPEWDGGPDSGLPPKKGGPKSSTRAIPLRSTAGEFSPSDLFRQSSEGPHDGGTDGPGPRTPLPSPTSRVPGPRSEMPNPAKPTPPWGPPDKTGASDAKVPGRSLFGMRGPPPAAEVPLDLFSPSAAKEATPASPSSPTGPAPGPSGLFGAPSPPRPAEPTAKSVDLFPKPAAKPAGANVELFPSRKAPPDSSAPRGDPIKLFGQRPNSLAPASLELDTDTPSGSARFGSASRGGDGAASATKAEDRLSDPKDVDFADAYEFVLKHILTERDGTTSPLYLVIGLSGAGKTTFLTVLGDILAYRKSKYYFPWDGIEVRRIDVDGILSRGFEFRQTPEPARRRLRDQFKLHVKDLVFEYAQEFFSKYLGREHWAPPTARNETFFLATELEYRQRSLAKIVTVETAGEAWKLLLYMLAGKTVSGADEKRLDTLRQLLDTAEGLIVLLDPSDDKTDDIYQNFFLILKDYILPRARNRARELIRERIQQPLPSNTPKLAPVGPLNFVSLQGDLRRKLEDEERRKRDKTNLEAELRDRINAVSRRLEIKGIEGLSREDTEFIDQLKSFFYRLDPKTVESAETFLKDHGYSKDAIGKFSSQMLTRGLKIIDKLVELQFQGAGEPLIDSLLSEEEMRIQEGWQAVAREKQLAEGFRIDINADNLLVSDPVTHFTRLKNIAIVVTKTDMYPIVYPPERYPEYKLSKSKQSIDPLENCLRLLGGGIRYYNASATGYSVIRNGRPMPGAENTLCPINIFEPIIEMLDLPK